VYKWEIGFGVRLFLDVLHMVLSYSLEETLRLVLVIEWFREIVTTAMRSVRFRWRIIATYFILLCWLFDFFLLYLILCRPLTIFFLFNYLLSNRFNNFLHHFSHLTDTVFLYYLQQTVDICELLITLTQLPLFNIDLIYLWLQLVVLSADVRAYTG